MHIANRDREFGTAIPCHLLKYMESGRGFPANPADWLSNVAKLFDANFM